MKPHDSSFLRSPMGLFLRPSTRRGSTLPVIIAVLVVLAGVGFLWLGVSRFGNRTTSSNSARPLVVYCAASNQAVFEAIKKEYEQAYGVALQVQYGPSQTLLTNAAVSKTGDLFLPADDSYLVTAKERDLTAEVFPLARMHAVIAVAKGNPKQIAKWEDLLQAGVRVSQASTEASAIGKLTKAELSKANLWDALDKHTVAYKTTVNEVANDVKVGAADAGIVFDAVLHGYESLEAVSLPELSDCEAHISAAVLKASAQPQRALHFARFLSATDKGLVQYQKHGFTPEDGDAWSDHPEVTLYAGSMLRPAIEKTITAFEEREGVKVLRVYNGCGILVAQMKAGEVPDAYFACDVEFMKQVKELFPNAEDISQNELVILVKKGNPLQIGTLKDLGKSNLRVGIGHEKQCAMGWLTQRTFTEGGVTSEIMKNVVVQTPTGDMLVNQMRSGSLDAAVAYLSNAAGSADALDAIRIQGLPCSVATQPFGTAKDSHNKRTMERLLQAIKANNSQQIFGQEGFRWVETKAVGS